MYMYVHIKYAIVQDTIFHTFIIISQASYFLDTLDVYLSLVVVLMFNVHLFE